VILVRLSFVATFALVATSALAEAQTSGDGSATLAAAVVTHSGAQQGAPAAGASPQAALLQAPAPAPQTAPASPAPTPAAPTPTPARVVAGQDGFAIESGNGDFRLQIGLLVHADGRFALDDTNDQVVDMFVIRRVRPYLRGRLARRFEFYLNPDFAGSTLVIQDAYLDTIFTPAFRVRTGKAKTPFGMERLHPASNLLFMERALPNALVPNRDVGIQVLGDVAGGLVSYLGGVMNGVPDGASADVDTTDSKDLAGRFIVRPFNRLPATSPLRGLHLAISGSSGRATGTAALPTLRTQTLSQPFFSYSTGATAAVADGTRTRYSPQVWHFYRAFGGWAEYVHTETPVRRGTVIEDIAHDAWQLTGSWVLTGENATDAGAGVRPRANFDFGNGNWGAFQIAARYHSLRVDEDAFILGLAAPGASRTADAWTVGLNWYLTGNIRYTFNFERTVFDDDPEGPRRAENALGLRTQLSF
jgi:phosphate-selective porin OprO/OprP